MLGTSIEDGVYLDAMGVCVSSGDPDENKAQKQIAAVFESLFWWVTVSFIKQNWNCCVF